MSKPFVSLAGLGLCEHCKTFLTVEGMSGEPVDAEWRCPECKEVLSGESFGYNKKGKRTRWVGPSGRWTRKKPTKDFELPAWSVIVGSLHTIHV